MFYVYSHSCVAAIVLYYRVFGAGSDVRAVGYKRVVGVSELGECSTVDSGRMPVAGQGESPKQPPAGSDGTTAVRCRRYFIISPALLRFHIRYLLIREPSASSVNYPLKFELALYYGTSKLRTYWTPGSRLKTIMISALSRW